MNKHFLIAPSLLSADFSKLLSEVKEVEKEGCDWIHVDVMDGHFVPNLTIGPLVVKDLRPHTQSILDCHLMVSKPEKWIQNFYEAGADVITLHVETSSTAKLKTLLKKIRSLGLLAGISLNPKTSVKKILPLLPFVDLVLVMSVEPGFGGQSFKSSVLKKVKELAKLQSKFDYFIEIDGGVNTKTISQASSAGAEIFVAGNAIFGNKNRKKAIHDLKKALL